MSNHAYELADMNSDPLHILLALEDDDGDDLESFYLAGRCLSRPEVERHIDGTDMRGASPFELAEFEMRSANGD